MIPNESKTQLSNVIKGQIKSLWGSEFWADAFRFIELKYYKLLEKAGIPKGRMTIHYAEPTEHRFEHAIRILAKETQCPNLHLGMTSSDIEDNIRVLRIAHSVRNVNILLEDLVSEHNEMLNSTGDCTLLAKTHLVSAGITTIRTRLKIWKDGIDTIMNSIPEPMFKGIRGSLGTRHIQQHIGMQNNDLDMIIRSLAQKHGITKLTFDPVSTQTGSHFYELSVACWIESICMVVGKLGNDLRQMIAFGQAGLDTKDIASTALAQKQHPNPWRLERAVANLEDLSGIAGRVARIGMNCLLERTLTNQSALNRLFERAFTDLAEALVDISHDFYHLNIVSDVTKKDKKTHQAEYRVVDKVRKEKLNRLEAYYDERN